MRRTAVARRKLRRAADKGQITLTLRMAVREARREQSLTELKERARRRLCDRRLLAEGGQKATKLFWEAVSGKQQRSSGIAALDDGNQVFFDDKSKARIIGDFFEKKFETQDNPLPEGGYEKKFSEEELGTPEKVLSEEEANKLMEEISQEEVDRAIRQLKNNKASGMDQLTNEMLKSAGPVARNLIRKLFNNVLVTGKNPEEWKIGDIVLALKRPPGSEIGNYRPITLISCLSKLLTKIMADRLSSVAESSGSYSLNSILFNFSTFSTFFQLF